MLTLSACDQEHRMGHFQSSTRQCLKAVAEEVDTESSNIKKHKTKNYIRLD